jgi:hypothetical protein
VGHFVRGEHDGGIFEEALREEIAERVVFFVEGEDGCVGDAWLGGGGVSKSDNVQGQVGDCTYVSQLSPQLCSVRRLAGRARIYTRRRGQLCAIHGGCLLSCRAVHSLGFAQSVVRFSWSVAHGGQCRVFVPRGGLRGIVVASLCVAYC